MNHYPTLTLRPALDAEASSAPQMASGRAGLTTEALAHAIGGKPSSIRVRLCKTGSYYGIRPAKLPNGRLLWPLDSVKRLLNRGVAR